MQKTQHIIHENRTALDRDEFGRVPSSMPPSLRACYEGGTWRKSAVYMWETVLNVSEEGHQLARLAQDELLHISHRKKGPVGGRVRAEHSTAVIEAVEVNKKLKGRMKEILMKRAIEKNRKRRALTREYMVGRQAWAILREESDADRESSLERDENLLLATRGPYSPSTEEIFNEIEQAGGTAGGLERWSRSITAIPDQNPNLLPAVADGGGILIEDPLKEHYEARMVNPWSQEERLLFLDKYILHGKNFRKIATFFQFKSVDDVVRFYYSNKLPYKLKALVGKDFAQKRRVMKRNQLLDLSRMPPESRSIMDNFRNHSNSHSPARRPARNAAPCPPVARSETMTDCWTTEEETRLVNALCRFDVGKTRSNTDVTWAWARIANAVETRTPNQCEEYYTRNRVARGLDRFTAPIYPPRGTRVIELKRPSSEIEQSGRLPTGNSPKYTRVVPPQRPTPNRTDNGAHPTHRAATTANTQHGDNRFIHCRIE